MLSNKEKLAQYLQNNKPLKLDFKQIALDLKLPKIQIIKNWNALNQEHRIVLYDNLVLECWNQNKDMPTELSPANENARKTFYVNLGKQLQVNPHTLIYVYAEHYQVPAFKYEPQNFRALIHS